MLSNLPCYCEERRCGLQIEPNRRYWTGGAENIDETSDYMVLRVIWDDYRLCIKRLLLSKIVHANCATFTACWGIVSLLLAFLGTPLKNRVKRSSNIVAVASGMRDWTMQVSKELLYSCSQAV